MSGAKRRNGQSAACEPCRKSKIRCDHGRPICGRCRRRSLHAACYYHPAPLTRACEDPAQRTDEVIVSTLPLTSSLVARFERSIPPLRVHEADDTPRSFSSKSATAISYDTGSPAMPSSIQHESKEDIIPTIAGLLDALCYFEKIRDAVNEFYRLSGSAWIPFPLLSPAIDSLHSLTGYDNLDGGRSMAARAQTLWQSTTTPLSCTATSTPAEFVASYIGSNLRLEFLGLLCSLAARSHLLYTSRQGNKDNDFVRCMLKCSTACLALARRLTSCNILSVYLSLEHMHLCHNIYGDQNEIIWHRLGDVSSDVLALGLHREANNLRTDIPYWLAECRRKIFIKAYTTSVQMSESFDRPSRLSRRHSDCALPLDLTDDEILASPEDFELAKAALSVDGWNLKGDVCASTYSRLRCMLVEIREEVQACEFQCSAEDRQTSLSTLLLRNLGNWERVPAHLRYTTYASVADIPARIRPTITLVYLTFLSTDLYVYKLQEREGSSPGASTLKVASDSLAAVVDLGAFGKSSMSSCDYSLIMFKYGLHAAVVITAALPSLVHSTAQPSQLPPDVTISSLIRNLSVYLSQLKSASTPDEPNCELCTEVSKVISRTLDSVLDGSFNSGARGLPTPAPTVVQRFQHGGEGSSGGDAVYNASADLGIESLDLWGDFDVDAWMVELEQSALSGTDWGTFLE